MTLRITIDEYSLAAKPLELRFGATNLGVATGFVWQADERAYLITNWHVVTGINPETEKHLLSHGGEPDRLVAQLDLFGSPPGTRGPVELPLLDPDGSPLWLEHPFHARRVDVVALPLPELPGAVLYPINRMDSAPILTFIGADAFILGYPFGVAAGVLPIWKRVSIASEPQVQIRRLPFFYGDTASRPGMSGAPVILRSWGGYAVDDGGGNIGWDVMPGSFSRFLGVYSGRIGAAGALEAQLGIIWRAEVVEQIISTPRPGYVR